MSAFDEEQRLLRLCPFDVDDEVCAPTQFNNPGALYPGVVVDRCPKDGWVFLDVDFGGLVGVINAIECGKVKPRKECTDEAGGDWALVLPPSDAPRRDGMFESRT